MSSGLFSVASAHFKADEMTWSTDLPLLAQAPYAVDVRPAFDRVALIGPGFEDVVPSELGRVMNTAVVALVHDTSSSARRQQSERNATPIGPELLTRLYTQGGPVPDPRQSCCIGLALVRAVSPALFPEVPQSTPQVHVEHPPVLHILTPIPPSLLGLGRCIVKGQLEIPIWGMLDHRESDKGRKTAIENEAPYLTWEPLRGLGADRRRVRRNLLRKGLM